MKQCPTFLVYNEVHYHIPSVVTFSNGEINEESKMTDAPSEDRSRERDYIIRERERTGGCYAYKKLSRELAL